jgi:hypothetical protein
MLRTAVLFLAALTLLRADERTQRLAIRLAEEAAAFQRVAPQVLGLETLEQRAQKPPRRFRIRVGKAATRPAEQEWQQRKIVSEYGFSTFASDGSLHELRQVTSVDGRAVKSAGPDALARIILASDDSRKRELLQQFEDYGLLGAVTDFGPLLMLFTPASIVRYEFSFLRPATIDNTPALVFSYKQIDGPNALTVFDAQRGQAQALGIAGEIWVRADYLPMRVTINSLFGDVRQEATVDYALSRFGALLPTATHHRESRAGTVSSENNFSYSDFKRFGASADIVFTPEEDSK